MWHSGPATEFQRTVAALVTVGMIVFIIFLVYFSRIYATADSLFLWIGLIIVAGVVSILEVWRGPYWHK